MQSMQSMQEHCVLNLNLTDGSKTEVCKKYARKRAIYASKCPQWVQKSGGSGVEWWWWGVESGGVA
jgi:hypothetical protein